MEEYTLGISFPAIEAEQHEEPESGKIKEQITLGTRRLVAAGGMSNFSFPKLSAETGIAAPTVYEHYKNKEDLLTSCYLAIDAEIGALLSGFLQNDPPHRHELEKSTSTAARSGPPIGAT